jgi:hypothetical protein
MSLFGKWFGRGAGATEASAARTVEHNGFTIEARPYKEGGQYQTAGVVAKDIGGERREHKFIRADRFQSLDEAVEFSLGKGRQLVDEQGERLFK